jgi:hypothetical protein
MKAKTKVFLNKAPFIPPYNQDSPHYPSFVKNAGQGPMERLPQGFSQPAKDFSLKQELFQMGGIYP